MKNFIIFLLFFFPIISYAEKVIWSDNFTTNTLDQYAALGIYYATDRPISGWSISDGKLHSSFGLVGMLGFKDAQGQIMQTPDHFSISYSYMPTYPETQAPYNQDHPGIVLNRTSSVAKELYLRPHSNQVVGSYTTNNNFYYTTVKSTSGLSVHSSYDLFFEVDFLSLTAKIIVKSLGGANLIHTATLTGTEFTNVFGTSNAGGIFGLMATDTDGASYDNLVVIDYTIVPEPGSIYLVLGMLVCFIFFTRK